MPTISDTTAHQNSRAFFRLTRISYEGTAVPLAPRGPPMLSPSMYTGPLAPTRLVAVSPPSSPPRALPFAGARPPVFPLTAPAGTPNAPDAADRPRLRFNLGEEGRVV